VPFQEIRKQKADGTSEMTDREEGPEWRNPKGRTSQVPEKKMHRNGGIHEGLREGGIFHSSPGHPHHSTCTFSEESFVGRIRNVIPSLPTHLPAVLHGPGGSIIIIIITTTIIISPAWHR